MEDLSLFFLNRKVKLMKHEYERYIYTMHDYRRRYGFWKFVGDVAMVFLTGGLWLIWIFVREMRRR
jgi:hypothetical protein